GTYSSTAGLSINASTGAIDLAASTAGTYTVTYTIAGANGCPPVTATASITITALPVATISYATPYCSNGGTATVTLTGTTGGTYSSTAGLSINASTGAIDLAASTAGTYTVTYTIAGANGCPPVTATASITITALPVATISYATPYCSNGGTATVTLTGTTGGTYSSTAGLSINASTGAIDLAASTAGTYTVTYTIAGANGCPPVTATASITITALPVATISYATPYCSNGGTATVTLTGTTGGTYSSTAGLSINASTGAVDLAASTAGTYTVTYTIAGANGCPPVIATASITVTALPVATIAYASPYCSAGTATVTLTGTTGGIYSSTAGLIINPSTGDVDLAASTPGTYTVTYTIAAANGCPPVTVTAPISIGLLPAATISYATPYCSNGGTATATLTGTAGGIYSSTAGLSINASTGVVDLAASTAGTYTVTYTIAAANGCPQITATTSITITALPVATISYATPYCSNGGTATVTLTGSSGGTYSSTAGLSINPSTGAVDLAASTAGTYTVTYTIAAANGCPPVTATASITITALPVATISYATPYCSNGGTATVTLVGTTGGTYSSTAGLTINASTGAVDLAASTPGTYTVTYTIAAANGCPQVTATANITITALPVATIAYASPFCSTAGTASVTLTGTTGGTYSSTAGLSINTSTGAVNITASTPGTYTVTYTIAAANGCPPVTATAGITITPLPVATISYATPYCSNAGTATVTLVGTTGGIYSSTAGLSINASTGAINLAGSTPGTYLVTYTIAAAGGCPIVTATASITITQLPAATISYPSPLCVTGTTAVVTRTGTAGGTYSSTAGLSINASTGTVTLPTSTPGSYTVTYTIAAAAGCPIVTTTTAVTISTPPIVTLNPADSGVCKFNGTTFTAAATAIGTPTPAIQWQVSTDGGNTFSNIPGATTSPYVIAVANANQDGWYYRAIFTNFCGTDTTTAALLSVSSPLNPQLQPVSQTGCDNFGTVSFSASGNGGQGVLSSVWQYSPDNGTTWIDIPSTMNSTNIGNISNTYTFTPTISQTGWLYRLKFINGKCAGSISNSATLTVNPIPVVNQPSNQVICKGSSSTAVTFTGTGTSYAWTNSNTGIGLGASGSGNIPSFTATNSTLSPITGTITVTPTYTGGVPSASCPGTPKTFTITVNPNATVSAGSAQTVCAGSSITLAGSIGGSATSATWTAPSGTFSNANSLTSTYTPSIASGTVTLTLTTNDPDGAGPCLSATATVIITVNPIATVNAGSPQTVCQGSSVTLAGTIGGGATSSTWSAPSGSFSNVNSLTSTYTPSITNGTVTLTLTTNDPAGPCGVVTSTVVITVNPIATVSAGSAQTVCAGSTITPLAGSFGGSATSVTWSAPSGTFSNPNSLSSSYTPSIASGTVLLTLTTNDPDGAGPCLAAVATALVTVNPIATVNAGSPQTICTGSSVTLAGTIGGSAASAVWSAPSGTFSNINSLTSTYTPSITNGTVTLTLTTNDPAGPCTAVTSTVTITVNPVATANAGSVQTVCAGSSITLAGTVGGSATSGTWTAPSGTFSNATSLTSTYTPSIASGTVSLTLTSNDPAGPCPAATATVVITVNPIATANAGAVQTVCAGGSVILAGTIGGSATSSVWSAPSGTFSNVNSLTSTYTPSITSGTVTLTLTTNDPAGPCLAVTSTVVITVNPIATANAGTAQAVCAGSSITLAGTIGGGATSSTWSAPSGTFSNASSLTSTYTPSITSGTVTLTLTTDDPAGPCPAVTSTVIITVNPKPTASIASTNVNCFGNSTGTATVTPSGGTSGYTYSWNSSPVQTGAIATGLIAGGYTVIVTDTKTCTATASVTITQPTLLVLSEIHTDVPCNGAASGSITISATGGTAPYTGTGTFTGLTAGIYTYTVTDANGCSKNISVAISENTLMVASETHTDILCNGSATGTITISASGGTGPYIGTGTFTGLTAGNYLYTVTDGNGCNKVVPVTITEPPLLVPQETHTNVLCNGGSTGTVTITTTGGTAPYTGTGTFTGLIAGTYSYTVTDANNCSKNISVTITEPTLLVASETHTNILCNGDNTGSVTISATGGTAPYTGTGTFTGLVAGTYSYTVTDANGCSKTVSVTITEPTLLVASEIHTDILCNGANTGSITISASGGTAPYTGTGTFTGLTAGTYNYMVTDANSCSKNISVTIAEPTLLVANEVHTDILCNGANTGSITISASGGTGPYTGTGTFSGLTAGTYSYTVTDANSCSKNISVTIAEPTLLIVTETNFDVLCNGESSGSVIVNATGGTGPYTGTGTFTGLAAGTYSYTVTDANNCSKTISVIISEPSLLTVNEIHTDVLCNGSSTGSITVTASGGTAPYTGTGSFTGLAAGTYSYTVTDANSCSKTISVTLTEPTPLVVSATHTNILCNSAATGTATVNATGGTAPYTGTGTFTGLVAGTYSYTVTDANNCSDVVSVTITEPTLLVAAESHTDVLCNAGTTGTATITATGGTAPYTGTGTFTGLAAGTYSYTVTDANNCTDIISVTIAEPAPLVAAESHTDVLCNAGTTGTATITATGGTAPYTGTGTFTGLAAGTYSYTVTDANNCTDIISVTIAAPAPLVAAESHTDVLCNAGTTGTATISASGGTAPYTGTGTFTGLAAGTYAYTVTDANNCTDIISVTIAEPALLVVTATPGSVGCNGGTSTVTVAATGGTAPYTGTGTFTGLVAGTYSYTVTDANSCSDVVSVTITEPTLLVAAESHTDVLCNAGTTGTATITATGGTAPYTGTGTFTGLAAGTYSYTVTDANNCTDIISVTIAEPTPLVAAEAHTDVLCNAGTTGTATITASGGTAPYTGTGTFTGLAAGTYSYTVTDANNCTDIISVTIAEPAPLVAAEAHTDVLCNAGTTGTATITASGGTAPYTGTGTFTGLAAGTYSYTVTDANNCTDVVSVTIAEPAVLVVTATPGSVGCNGGTSTVTVAATGGTAPYTGTGTFTGLVAGTYSYTVTDANNCTDVVSVTITEPTLLVAAEAHTDVLCNAGTTGTATITATGGTAPYTGTGTFTGLAAGTY
ncbi:MAG: hypothetical protein V4556_09975, partial [Bacteroidota bacterium]